MALGGVESEVYSKYMSTNPMQSGRSVRSCSCGPQLDRRDFLRVVGLGAAGYMVGSMPIMAGPFETPEFEALIPSDKKLQPDWVKALFERGSRTIYRGDELKTIGMPINGICSGQVYLGGDGKLWYWDIFNKYVFTGYDAVTYVRPRVPSSPFDQGFTLKVTADGSTKEHTLDSAGFSDISFNGEYPFGFVEYKDASCSVAVSLEAFSPFTPLSVDDSNLPATVMRYTLRNTGANPVDVELTGHMENAASVYSRYVYGAKGTWQNRIVRDGDLLKLECGVKVNLPPPVVASNPPTAPRSTIVFADFEGPDYGAWTTEGDAFGKGPIVATDNPPRVKYYQGKSFANSYAPQGGDKLQGKLTSPEFTVERSFINFMIGGGITPEIAINLLVDGNVVRTSTPVRNSEDMKRREWDVSEYEGKKARIEIVDHATGPWGHIEIDQIQFDDTSKLQPFAETHDLGGMALALLQAGAGDTGSADGQAGSTSTDAPINAAKKLTGSLTSKVTLKPNETHTATFVIAWHFPNLGYDPDANDISHREGRLYAKRFENAAAVAKYVSDNFEKLYGQTKTWHDTWYDSTLPYWLLDRTLLNVSILATSTAFQFADGLFYGWEGVGCCAGTCTHVWSYEQCMGRIFPELDRNLRERVDYKGALRPDGEIGNRSGGDAATDGQAGTILRTYRDHQTSPDNEFLKRNWDNIKKAIGWLIAADGNDDGLIEGKQPNTMDEDWYGPVPWMSGMYLAALRCGEEMAKDMGDADFAKKCRAIFDAGQKNFVQRLWKEENGYFVQLPDPQHHEPHQGSYDGCEADQVYGQSWGHQVGLGRVLPEKETKQALGSLWKYNFAPDVGPYRKQNGGRWYAMAGEAGLVICTWPQAKGRIDFNYCSECWTGIEHHVAGHMIWEGMVMEGLAIERAVHDRYHPSRRNPWNEVECGDHYARAMSSLGVFIAACGFEYNGPRGTMAFAPRLTPENFRSAFTASEGWGTFAQTHDGLAQHATLEVKWGELGLKTLTLTPVKPGTKGTATATLNGQNVPLTARLENDRVVIDFNDRLNLSPQSKLEVVI
jgi:non-lysosomal glucosylceramidase